jgi:hypothetical protein
MKSVGSHNSSSLLFVVKVIVCHFVSDSHKVMTAHIVILPSLQFHRYVLLLVWVFFWFFLLSVFLLLLLSLAISFYYMFCWASQHHGWVFPSLLVLWQKLIMVANVCDWPPSTVRSWRTQWGCYDSWSVLLKVPENMCDCCSDHTPCLSSVFKGGVFVFFLFFLSSLSAKMLAKQKSL